MENISNQELRQRLIALGYNPPPVTDTSREILLKKLKKLESTNTLDNGNVSVDGDKHEVQSRKTRSAAKTQELPADKTNNVDYSYKNLAISKSSSRQPKSSKSIENDFKNNYDSIDSNTNLLKRSKTSTPNVESYSSKSRDPFERASDSDDPISYASRSPNSSLARKPLNTRRESEYYSSVRTPPSMYRKYDTNNGVSSYLDRDVYRSKLYNNNARANRWSKFTNKISLKKIAPTAVLIIFVLFFLIVAAIYFSKNDRIYGDLSLDEIKYHKCSERPRANSPCIPDNEVDGSLKCLKTVYQALWKNEANKVCGNRKTSPTKNFLTPDNVTELLVTENLLLRYEAEKMIHNMELLVNANPQLNINYAQSEGFVLEHAELPWQCSFRSWFSSLFNYAFYMAAAIPLLFSMHTLFRWGMRRHEERAKDKQELIKGILEILQQNAIANPSQTYLPIVHVRDQLITYEDRERKKKLWAEAVKYVEENESRIRKEIQPFQGEDYDVWRWVGGHSLSLPKPKTWHGEAFETSKDTMNTPSTSPTPCLKIRNMFDPKNETANDDWVTGVKDAILERCEGVNVVHMMVEETNPEGCVYIKCASTDDAGKAYRKMHGAWFDGKIVSVKYLRLERYHERFPSSVDLVTPLTPSNDQKRSIV